MTSDRGNSRVVPTDLTASLSPDTVTAVRREVEMVAGASPPLVAAATASLATLLARPLEPGLYLVATPIGHLGDISLRALATLATVDRIYCEDTRHSLRLLNHYAINRPLTPYHDHNAEAMRPRIIDAIGRGDRVALISDAGTPLISDPGYKLVRAVVDAGQRVVALPGASAVLAALSVAGLPTDAFYFAGFVPAKAGARRTALMELLARTETVVVYEAPTRLAETIAALAELAPDRDIAIARELTKLHETVLRGTTVAVAAMLSEAVRGECVVLIGPAARRGAIDDAVLEGRLRAALAQSPLSAAVRDVARATGAPRNRVYDLALALRGEALQPDADETSRESDDHSVRRS